MQTSQTIIAVIAQLLVVFLPMFGITVGSAELTNAIQTIAVVGTGIWIWIRRVQVGDIKWFGGRKTTYADN